MSVRRHQDEFSQEHKWFVQKAKRLAIFCHGHNFAGWQCLQGLKMRDLAIFYDGIGPDWDWSVVAKIAQHIDVIFEPAAFIQDIQYRVAEDRSEQNFHKVNYEFYQNCLKCIELKTRWWHFVKRHNLKKSAKILFEESEAHGIESWKAGFTGMFNRADETKENEE